MRNRAAGLALTIAIALSCTVTFALDAGKDVFVPAAARAGSWYTDLYLFNPGAEPATLTVSWLLRGRANPDPSGVSYQLAPGESLVLTDAIAMVFGLDNAGGAFRITSDQDVVVNTRIYNQQGGVTFGQGFAGVPRSSAVTAGGTTDIVGLTSNTGFRCNLVLLDTSGTGSTVELSLRDSSGAELASGTYELRPFEPVLDPVSELDGVTSFDYAVLHAEVTSGAAIIVASKVDNDPATGDPTTLESWRGGGDTAEDGTYQLSIYDSNGYATGGYLRIADGIVTGIDATYSNWDKGAGEPICTHTFRLGSPESGSHPLGEYAAGVSFSRGYDSGATITWTLSMTIDKGTSLTGTVAAVGSGFPSSLAGCNGTFPRLQLRGGKTE